MQSANKKTWALLAGLLCCGLASANTGSDIPENPSSTIIDLSQPVVSKVGDLEFRECQVEAQGRDRTVQCAWHELPENPAVADGKQIKLFIVRLPARRKSKNLVDPVLFLAGGPGQAASEAYLFTDQSYSSLAKQRDFYLIDQRGTGRSNPMGCDQVLNQQDLLVKEYEAELVKDLARRCLDVMPGDVRYYTTDVSVEDFESVRKALKVPQWNLLGVSYGTRVATHYMRKYPTSIRSVVLDSVVPPQHVLGEEIAIRSQASLDVLFERCNNDESCKEKIPDLKKDVNTLFKKLEHVPLAVQVENFSTGEIENLEFTREHLTVLLRMYLYNSYSIALLPPMLHEAAVNNNYAPLARAANKIVEALSGAMSVGLHNSVMCTEEAPFFTLDEKTIGVNKNTYMGMDVLNLMVDICSVWPKGEVPTYMKTPLQSDIPTLLFSGEFDPITPPEYAETTMQTLSNAKHFVLEGQGHSVSASGCAPHLVDKFVDDASSEWLDAKCLGRISAAPLYINFNGSAP